ncbi:MAG: YchE family NAAT transporter [Arsenophonus sp.]|nr:YchE family NAAT transporter [Arsenophonus sp.]
MVGTLLDLPNYIKFFLGLFALVNPIGILPVFISMTNYQSVTERNRTNLVANFSVAIILCISLLVGEVFLKLFGISIDSFRIAGGIVIAEIAMSMISGRIGEDKQNKQEKSETAIRDSIGVVPLALPLMAGPGAISSCIVWSSRWLGWQNLVGLSLTCIFFALCCWLLFRSATILVKYLGQTGINVITRIMGLLLMSLGIEFIITGTKSVFPGLL